MRRFPIVEFFAVSAIALCVFCLWTPPDTVSGWSPPAAGLVRPASAVETRSSVEAEEHTLFVLRPTFTLPEGHEVFGVHWRTSTLDVRLFESETVAVGTGPPGNYRVEFFASHAKVKTDADGDRVMVFPPASVAETWSVHIQGAEPPLDPKPGQASAAIIYDAFQGPPVAGEGATNELRNAGKSVFFASAGAEAGTGSAPAFLANAIEAAKQNGLPALVLMVGDTVTSVADLPATKAEIVAAVK